MRPRILTIAAAALVAAFPSLATPLRAQLTATEVMERNFHVTKVSAVQFEATMILTNDRGQSRERKMSNVVKLQPNGVDSKFLVRFTAPADIRGTGFLQVEHSDGDDDLWIYLPALKRSRRLVASNKKDSFVGSDFSYGDIALPKVDRYEHTLRGMEEVDGVACYVVVSVPRTAATRATSGYGRKVSWIRSDNFLEAKVEYYDLTERLLKTQVVQKHQLVEKDTGRWFALYREMTNHRTGHRTTFTIDRVTAGISLPDDMFTTRYIER